MSAPESSVGEAPVFHDTTPAEPATPVETELPATTVTAAPAATTETTAATTTTTTATTATPSVIESKTNESKTSEPVVACAFTDIDGAGSRVLVTGASGYIGHHIVLQLLKLNYRVRGTVRSLSNEKIVADLNGLFPESQYKLELVEADLLKEDSWIAAVEGQSYVIHTASPFIYESKVKNVDKELIEPAVQGTLAVLKAAASTHGIVKRVVLTSSLAAVSSGHDGDKNYKSDHIFTETDFSNPKGKMDAYNKSKTLAEAAAWEFVKGLKEEDKFEFCTVNPGLVQGPLLSAKGCTSADLLERILTKEESTPKIGFPLVDVRDVALVHIRALSAPASVIANHRFLCAQESVWFNDIAQVLAKEFNPQGYNVSTGQKLSVLLSIFGNKEVKVSLGKNPVVNANRVPTTLGVTWIDWKKSVVEMAYSLIQKGLVPDKKAEKEQAEAKKVEAKLKVEQEKKEREEAKLKAKADADAKKAEAAAKVAEEKKAKEDAKVKAKAEADAKKAEEAAKKAAPATEEKAVEPAPTSAVDVAPVTEAVVAEAAVAVEPVPEVAAPAAEAPRVSVAARVSAAAPRVSAAAPRVSAAAPVVAEVVPVVEAVAPVTEAAAPLAESPVVEAAARVSEPVAPVTEAAPATEAALATEAAAASTPTLALAVDASSNPSSSSTSPSTSPSVAAAKKSADKEAKAKLKQEAEAKKAADKAAAEQKSAEEKKAKEETKAKAKAEADAKKAEEATKKAEAAAKAAEEKKAREEAKNKAKADAEAKKAEEATKKAEEAAKKAAEKAEVEAKKLAEKKAAADAKLKAKAEADAKKAAEAEAKKPAVAAAATGAPIEEKAPEVTPVVGVVTEIPSAVTVDGGRNEKPVETSDASVEVEVPVAEAAAEPTAIVEASA